MVSPWKREENTMNQQRNIVRFSIGLLFLTAVLNPALLVAQRALERLEKQIRERVEQDIPIPPSPGTAAPTPPAPGPGPAQVREKWEPGYLGLQADDRQDRGRGVRVLEISAEGPAAKGGLKKQDLITAVSGVRTRQMSDMADLMNLYSAGESVEIEVLRDNTPLKVKVTLGRRPQQKSIAGQTVEAIPLPPGEVLPPEPAEDGLTLSPPKEPAKESFPSRGTKKPSLFDFLKPKTGSAATGNVIRDSTGTPVPPPPLSATLDDRPAIEKLEKRIEQLERRVAELEKALEDAKK
jgi:hypothetical protein